MASRGVNSSRAAGTNRHTPSHPTATLRDIARAIRARATYSNFPESLTVEPEWAYRTDRKPAGEEQVGPRCAPPHARRATLTSTSWAPTASAAPFAYIGGFGNRFVVSVLGTS